ncbi:general substrate transporter [Suillus paluster]|uniref:general substrate transporter n=1 Tax=Suillus paluster TaxID=48578 RepID=UPI001B878504|nr:general substrate transporter [Suillus paluster]KAG1749038.1 general substrate transporter [Suillus paluster]
MVSATTKIYLIALHTSLAGMLWGLDTGSIGPITQMEQFASSIGHLSSGVLGIYVACILLSASFSSLCSGYVADLLSRKYGILTGGIVVLLGTIISASAKTFPVLVCARLITGIGQGQSISVVTIYLCEISPQEIRGTVATMLQLLITIGIALGYFVAYGSSRIEGSLAWRIPFILEASMAAILVSGMAFMPYSPRWLVERGRINEARAVLQKLRASSELVEEELCLIKGSLEEQSREHASYREIFQKRYVRRSVLGVFLMAFQMLCGIDAVLYYAPILFTQAGFSSTRAAFLASGISGIINLIFTIPAQLWVDKWGRRFPLIGGGIAIATCFMAIGALYATYGGKANGEVYLSGKGPQWAVIILIYMFVASFSWSWAVVIKIYACEIIPTRLRAKACAIQQLSNWLVNFVVALTAPLFLRASPSGPYFFFGSATLFTTVVCHFFMPETKGKSLEEIEDLFEMTPRAIGHSVSA